MGEHAHDSRVMCVKEKVKIFCLCLLAGMLFVIFLHLPGWLQGIDHLIEGAQIAVGNSAPASESMKQAADTFNMASTEMLDVVGNVDRTLDRLNRNLDGTFPKVNRVLDSTGDLVASTTTQVNDLGGKSSQTLADFNVDLATVTGKTSLILNRIPPVLDSSTAMLDASTATVTKAGTLFDNTNPLVQNSGKITGDMYVKLHPFLNPDPGKKVGIWGLLFNGAGSAVKATTPLGEWYYYWHQGIK